MIGQLIRAIFRGLGSTVSSGEGGFWMPKRLSTIAEGVDWNWAFIYWISVFFFALITFLLVYLTLRYRGRKVEPSTDHNMPLEIVWSVIPTLIVIVVFWFGYVTYLDMTTPPANAYEIQVTGQKWNWAFTYPNGHLDSELHVPVNTPVRLVMTSVDVIHSFYVPELRLKRDVMPGRYDKLWFEAVDTGEFVIFCAEYCGTDHSQMMAPLIVQERGEFDAWLEAAADFLSRMPPAEAGELLYNKRGCKQCHSVDGAANVGPTFKNLFGSRHAMADDSTVDVDENYIRESILQPRAKVVAGYDPVMPTYQGRLKDEEITAIIEYMKKLAL